MEFSLMIPRLKSSKKWTALPLELCTQICDVYTESFPTESKVGQFVVEGRIYGQELLFRAGYLEKGRLRQLNIEVSVDFDANKQNALELIYFTVDCAASMIQEVFSKEQDLEDFPHQWKSFKIEKKNVFLQVSTVNSSLESEADRLLNSATHDHLVNEDDEIDDAEFESSKEKVITMLGLADKNKNDFQDENED
jgi:hypothetical protein